MKGLWQRDSRQPRAQPNGQLQRQAVIKYPPVGASQSNISPAQNTPGTSLSINSGVKASQERPPAVEMASSMVRDPASVKGAALMAVTSPSVSRRIGRVSSNNKARFVASSLTDFRKKLPRLSFGLRFEIIARST
jgi:hypothetical protein